MKTGELIKLYRTQKGLTQEALGNLISVTGTTINRYEKGQRKITVESLNKIATALNIQPFDLLSIEDYQNDIVDEYDHSFPEQLVISNITCWINKFLTFNGCGSELTSQTIFLNILNMLESATSIEDPEVKCETLRSISDFISFKLCNSNEKEKG